MNPQTKPENKSIITSARQFARTVHDSTDFSFITIWGENSPQIMHLQEVADLVWASGGSDIEIAGAWLHDSVEDTPTTIEDIKKEFGKEIAEIVSGLTDLPEIGNLPTPERKARQAERVKNESESVRRIKLADQTSNIRKVTSNPSVSWSYEHNRGYVIGAKSIADNCSGISPVLDVLFEKEWQRAKNMFGV